MEIITPTEELVPIDDVKGMGQDPAWHDGTSHERKLWNIARDAEGYSGRYTYACTHKVEIIAMHARILL